MEVLALFFYLFVQEPTVQLYRAFGDTVSANSDPLGWGLGFRVRIPVSQRDALRLRMDGGRFPTHGSAPAGIEDETRTTVCLDYLWRGRGWSSSWYGGVGAGWLHRNQPVLGLEAVKSDGIVGAVILGRAQKAGNGQLVFETRFEIGGLAGQTAPSLAFGIAYRYHFKDL